LSLAELEKCSELPEACRERPIAKAILEED
jgi:hypothetical protein